MHKHVYDERIIDDQEVYEFIYEHLPYITQPSIRRFYVNAVIEKRDFPNLWKKTLLHWMGVSPAKKLPLEADPTLGFKARGSVARCLEAFQAAGHGGQATFYRLLAEMRKHPIPPQGEPCQRLRPKVAIKKTG